MLAIFAKNAPVRFLGACAWWALLVASGPPARAQEAPPPTLPPTPLEEVLVSAPEPRYVAPNTRDSIGRIWAPVLINGKGPFRLVLDTGASRSAVTQRVVDRAGLPLQPKPVALRGVTGTAVVPAVKAETLAFGELVIENSVMPVVADAFGGADGVLGSDGMGDKRIEIQFLRDRITIARSRNQRAAEGFAVMPFKHAHNRGMRVDAMVGPIRTTALIDSGAQVTVGNLALREALARRRNELNTYDQSIMGVTEQIQAATRVRIPSIVAGGLIVKNPNILFSDLHILGYWQLNANPALVIGMDVLGSLDTLIIDYRRNELHVKTRRL